METRRAHALPKRSKVLAFAATVAVALLGTAGAFAATFTVSSNGDRSDSTPGDGVCFTGVYVHDGTQWTIECTLRAAIEEANASSAADVVEFADFLPKAGGYVEIQPQSALPTIVRPLTIDGYTADGYALADPAATPIVNLLGGQAGAFANGLRFGDGSDDSTVRGLAIHGFDRSGILVYPSSSTFLLSGITIEGCHLGVWRGIFYRGNGLYGLYLHRTFNASVGLRCTSASCDGRRNLVADNADSGIVVSYSTHASIAGNYIGTNRFGTHNPLSSGAQPNGNRGIYVNRGGQHTIGSAAHPDGFNLVSGNDGGGILVFQSDGNVLQNNRIGTDAAGDDAIPNDGPGIYVNGVDNLIGGTAANEGNLISGNAESGIESEDGLELIGNTIGLSLDRTAGLGNQQYGVYLRDGSEDAVVRENWVGGNGFTGILLEGASHTVSSNHVGTDEFGADFGNGGDGIKVSGTGHVIGWRQRGNVIGFNRWGVVARTSAEDTSVYGNYIGTNDLGDDLGNQIGVLVYGADTRIGAYRGLTIGWRNVIGRNTQGGIVLMEGSRRAEVMANYVGTDRLGRELPNAGRAITAYGSDHTIGGEVADTPEVARERGNVIFTGDQDGISAGSAGTGVVAPRITLRGNRVTGSSSEPAFDLERDGPTANDVGDVDAGSNRRQNFPEFDLAQTQFNPITEELEVRYRVDTNEGDAAYPLTIDFYLRSDDEPGIGTYIGSDIYPDSSATLERSVSVSVFDDALPLDGLLVATATDAAGNTSEFSRQWVPVPEPAFGAALGIAALSLSGLRRRRG